MIPLLHDFTGATVLVFGGGPVGARKARRFSVEARVIVVSPSFADADLGPVERIRAAPRPADIPAWLERADPALVVAATDDGEVNAAIERAALASGILVNRADRGGSRAAGRPVVPATVREGSVVVAVSTEGESPALSAAVRDRLATELEAVSEATEAIDAVRSRLPAGTDPAVERELVARLARSEALWAAAAADDGDATAAAMRLASESDHSIVEPVR